MTKRGRKPKNTAVILKFSRTLSLGFDGMCYHLTSTLKDQNHIRATTDNEHKTTFYFSRFSQVIHSIISENSGELEEDDSRNHFLVTKSNLKKLEKVKKLIHSRRKATTEDLPRIMKLVENKGDYDIDYIHPVTNKKIKSEGLYMNKKSLENYIFEANIKMKRFESIQDVVNYLETEWTQ